MRYGKPTVSTNPARRAELLDEARACGRMGSSRPSDACLFADGVDPTQTFIGLVLESFDSGKAERAQK